MVQLIHQPTHKLGKTFDFIINFPTQNIVNAASFPIPYADHHLIWTLLVSQ